MEQRHETWTRDRDTCTHAPNGTPASARHTMRRTRSVTSTDAGYAVTSDECHPDSCKWSAVAREARGVRDHTSVFVPLPGSASCIINSRPHLLPLRSQRSCLTSHSLPLSLFLTPVLSLMRVRCPVLRFLPLVSLMLMLEMGEKGRGRSDSSRRAPADGRRREGMRAKEEIATQRKG